MNKFYIYLFLAFFITPNLIHAEVDPALVSSRRTELESQLKSYETQIDQYQNLVLQKQKEGESLKRDIDILTAQISSAKIAIKARTLAISELGSEINQKSKNIAILEVEITDVKKSLGEFLLKVMDNDKLSAVELAVIYDDLSQFFGELESLNKLQGSLQVSLNKYGDLKDQDEKAKNDLEDQKSEELQLKAIQELQKSNLESNEKQKQRILKETKGKESEYQKVLKENQKNAASIRSQLFLLNGSIAIPFEKAIEYANLAEKATGIRPAFLLGLITEESNLGQNVGKGNWKTDLSNSRCRSQREAFVNITGELGLDPDAMPVSKKVWYGYCGGAMGPAQFIPTTWQLFKNRVSKITGHTPSSPWDPKDAFVAASLLLTDNGAIAGNYDSEWKAAMKYLAGSNWKKKAYRFYGDDVMAIAVKYQDQIALLAQR